MTKCKFEIDEITTKSQSGLTTQCHDIVHGKWHYKSVSGHRPWEMAL